MKPREKFVLTTKYHKKYYALWNTTSISIYIQMYEISKVYIYNIRTKYKDES